MLRLENISYGVDDHPHILKDISMDITQGETLVITGPNGSGKSTLMKTIAGVTPQSSGRLFLDEEDLTHKSITERAQAGIAYAFQHPVRFKGFTARDMLEMSLGGPISQDQACGLLSKVGLCTSDYIDRPLDDKLSGGEIKRIEIASVLARPAKVYMFDEPEAGIDLWSFHSLIDVFEDLKAKSKATIIIISHQERIITIADRLAVIAEGQIQHLGPKDAILPLLDTKPTNFHCLTKTQEAHAR